MILNNSELLFYYYAAGAADLLFLFPFYFSLFVTVVPAVGAFNFLFWKRKLQRNQKRGKAFPLFRSPFVALTIELNVLPALR